MQACWPELWSFNQKAEIYRIQNQYTLEVGEAGPDALVADTKYHKIFGFNIVGIRLVRNRQSTATKIIDA